MATKDKPAAEEIIHPDCNRRGTAKSVVADPLAPKPEPGKPGATTPAATTAAAATPDAATADAEAARMKEERGFFFDAIVIRLDISSKEKHNGSKIEVDVMFNNKSLKVTSSRINILDFKPGKSYEFSAKPETLKDELAKNPLRIKVTEEDNVLGYGKFDWPDTFLEGILDCDGEMTQSVETELKLCDGTKTGNIHLLTHLQPKCKEYEEDISPDGQCPNAHTEIQPTDVLFVVGEEKNNCCCSQVGIIPASDSDHDLRPMCLDLSNFRPLNSQNVDNVDIFSSIDPACQRLKSFTNHYEKLINAVKSPSKKCEAGKEHGSQPQKRGTFLCNIPSDTDYMPNYCASEGKDFMPMNLTNLAHRMTPPKLIENEPESLRNCPLCKANMAYLPKLAACPNCCYKPVPYFEEKSYDDERSADEIMKECQNNLQTDDNNTSSNSNAQDDDTPKCRCTCKYGIDKPCAHCRIRKLCENIFNPPPKEEPAKICKRSSGADCDNTDSRPFLSKIFSELKDLYDIQAPKKKVFKPDEKCEKELRKDLIKKYRRKCRQHGQPSTSEQNHDSDYGQENNAPKKCTKRRKRRLKPAIEKAVHSRLYDYEIVRDNPSANARHKTCVNGFGGRKNVPPNMGWLWNVHQSGKWKPGAIRKPIKELMRYFLKDFPADTLLVSQYSYRKYGKNKNPNPPAPPQIVQKPTLHIYKRNGEFIITMRPLKPPKLLKDAADPYENMKPIQFRITKNPMLQELREIKQRLKDMGFKKCECHKPIIYCYCRSFLEKKNLEYQCNKECRKRQMSPCSSTLVLSDTSDSEAEFNFGVTPPAGVIKPDRLKKLNLINVGTQYNEIDWNPEPLFPRPPNKYMQMYQCAVKERKGKKQSHGGGDVGGGGGVSGGGGGGFGGGIGGGRAGGFGGGKGGFSGGGGGIHYGGGGGMGGGIHHGGGGGMGGGIHHGGGGMGGGDASYPPRAPGIDFSGKYGGRPPKKPEEPEKPTRKVDMMKYTQKANRKYGKLTPAQLAAKRAERMKLLRGVNPPILCTIDRRGKPYDPCCPPCGDYRIC